MAMTVGYGSNMILRKMSCNIKHHLRMCARNWNGISLKEREEGM